MFEQEALNLTRKFGIEQPESTIGYRLVLAALQDAYRRGAAIGETEEAKAETKKTDIETGIMYWWSGENFDDEHHIETRGNFVYLNDIRDDIADVKFSVHDEIFQVPVWALSSA